METRQKIREAKILMTWYLLYSALLVLMCQNIEAQPATARVKEYKTWLRFNDESFNTSGIFVTIRDSIFALNDPMIQGYEFSNVQKGSALATLFSGTGAGLGTKIGSVRVKFSIKGEIQTFETINEKLKQYSLQQCRK